MTFQNPPAIDGSRAMATVVLCVAALLSWLVWPPMAAHAKANDIRIAYLAHRPPPPTLYDFDATPPDEGAAGGRLASRDNSTTGLLTGQTHAFEEVLIEEGQSPVEAARTILEGGVGLLVLNVPADELLATADALKDSDVLILNAGAPDDRLRGVDCRPNVFHIAPSRAMLADALAQFLATKRWRNVFLVVGPKPADLLYADAVRRSARKFGLKIVAEKKWDFGALARARADGPTQAEALVFTRGVEADILIVADEAADFGNYIPFHTWDPKLVAGTQGLVAATWHRVQDAWGSAQLQSRFYKAAKRAMRPVDYQVWTAVRSIGEAATRTRSGDPATLRRFMLSAEFELAAFKGVPLSFRSWDRQMRQPILIAQPMALVTIAPQPGFLHQRTPLDTLGVDQPESECRTQ